jgi:uncharacterized caspase-like protein
MTTRRTFIKALAALPPVLSFRPGGAAVAGAPDPSRLALVIGNSSYGAAPLSNPANDARSIGTLLSQAGFTVESHLDATHNGMMAAIERFGAAVKRTETRQVVFYYAGHGAQLDWRNYLLPVDALVEKPEHIRQRCIDLGLLLGQFRAAKDKTFIVILDACRNNPFGNTYRPEQKGLSQFDAPVGSLLAYATSPGNVASDGEGKNGLYTEHLVRELSQRNTRIEDALKRVRLNVRLASHGAQIPWETTSLEEDVFIFNGGHKKLSEAELEQQVEADVTDWSRIKSSKRIEDWVNYLRSFPNGRFAEIAQVRLARLLAEDEERAAEERRREEQRQQEARRNEERVERERLRLAEEQRLAEEHRLREQQQLAETRRRLDRERLADERKQQDRQRLLAEQKRIEQIEREAKERDEARRIETQRAEAELVAAAQRQADDERRRSEQQALDAARPAPGQAPAPAADRMQKPTGAPGAPLIAIKAGIPVPVLIAPSANPYSAGHYRLGRIYTIGDVAVMRQTDILTGLEERTYSPRVTRVDYDEDRVEYNLGLTITDLMGNPIKSGPVEFDTPVQWTPAEFQVGKKWTAAFRRILNGRTSSAYYDMQIVRRETVEVPAGRFDAFRIGGVGWNITEGARLEVSLWLVPGLNFPVRREFVTRNRAGRYGQSERHELVALRQHAVGAV